MWFTWSHWIHIIRKNVMSTSMSRNTWFDCSTQWTSISREKISLRISGFLPSFSCCSGSSLTTSPFLTFASRSSMAFSSFFKFLNFFWGSTEVGGALPVFGWLKKKGIQHLNICFKVLPYFHFRHCFLQGSCGCWRRALFLLFGFCFWGGRHNWKRVWGGEAWNRRGGRGRGWSHSWNVATLPCLCYSTSFGLVRGNFILKQISHWKRKVSNWNLPEVHIPPSHGWVSSKSRQVFVCQGSSEWQDNMNMMMACKTVDGKMSKWQKNCLTHTLNPVSGSVYWLATSILMIEVILCLSVKSETPQFIDISILRQPSKYVYLCATEWITEDQCKNHSMSKEYYNIM